MTGFYRQASTQPQGASPLILTALLEPEAAARFEAMRRAYFPVNRNMTPAHLTLFHALPGVAYAEIEDELAERCWQAEPFVARARGLRFLGAGVTVDIHAPPLVALHVSIAQSWADALTPQDRQRFNPHVTVQNKVSPTHARQTYDALQTVFEPFDFVIEGLELWHYRGGPWEAAGRFPFGGAPI
jgi:2'-5' RNA ligase